MINCLCDKMEWGQWHRHYHSSMRPPVTFWQCTWRRTIFWTTADPGNWSCTEGRRRAVHYELLISFRHSYFIFAFFKRRGYILLSFCLSKQKWVLYSKLYLAQTKVGPVVGQSNVAYLVLIKLKACVHWCCHILYNF